MRVAMLGAGSWGTALAYTLATKGYQVAMWDLDLAVLESISTHENTRYLPGITLPPSVWGEPDLPAALANADLVVFAVPSHAMRVVAQQAAHGIPAAALLCSVTKGIEVDTLLTMSEVLRDVLPTPLHRNLTFLSGPSFAVEVAREFPTAVTIAGTEAAVTEAVQRTFHTPFLRPYVSDDVVGVEIGGCAKNVIAIATGAGDGMGYDANTRAATITRGLAEIARLAVARGANPLTLAGLSGVGDLVLTCSSVKSRNYRVGFGLGQGRRLEEIQAELGQVAEGVLNARSVKALAERAGVEMPICDVVHAVLYDGLDITNIRTLFSERPLRSEPEHQLER